MVAVHKGKQTSVTNYILLHHSCIHKYFEFYEKLLVSPKNCNNSTVRGLFIKFHSMFTILEQKMVHKDYVVIYEYQYNHINNNMA